MRKPDKVSRKRPKKAEPAEKRGRGRPTDYRPEYLEQAEKLCALGATDGELADFFHVAVSTLYLWKATHADFSEAIKVAKEAADKRVESSLYWRANGYWHDSVKIFMPAGAREPVYAPFREYVPPDTTAMIFWLKNRKPGQWRDKVNHELGGGPLVVQATDADLARALAAFVAKTRVVQDEDGTSIH